jgi:hypothetical protein
MMAFLLGERTDSVSKFEGVLEVLEPKDALEPLNRFTLNHSPVGNLTTQILKLRPHDRRRIATACTAFFVGKSGHSSSLEAYCKMRRA